MSSELLMPWGKFKGQEMAEIPSGYLKWLAENCEDETICCAADEEFSERTDTHSHFWD